MALSELDYTKKINSLRKKRATAKKKQKDLETEAIAKLARIWYNGASDCALIYQYADEILKNFPTKKEDVNKILNKVYPNGREAAEKAEQEKAEAKAKAKAKTAKRAEEKAE